MISRGLDKFAAFFQRPGVTPARVAPWLALAVLVPAFLIGMNLEPVGQDRASSEEAPLVVAGGGQPPAPVPAAEGAGAGAVAGANADSGEEEPADSGSGSDSADAPLDDAGGAPLPEPLPEPSLAPEPSVPADGGSGSSQPEDDAEDRPTDEPTESYEGTVVRVNQAAQSYAIATGDQDLVAIHADKLPKPGAAIRVDVRALANGTYAEAADRESLDAATAAAFRGWVTWIAEDGSSYTVSNRGVSLLVGRPEKPESPEPGLGAPVLVSAEIDPDTGSLVESSVEGEGERTDAPVHLTGIVREVDAEARQVTITADDLGQSEADLTLAVTDPKIDPAKIEVDQVVNATVVIDGDGGYTLTGVSANNDAKSADDQTTAQGDQVEQEDPQKLLETADQLLRTLGIL